jgi:hypothetical protein
VARRPTRVQRADRSVRVDIGHRTTDRRQTVHHRTAHLQAILKIIVRHRLPRLALSNQFSCVRYDTNMTRCKLRHRAN